MNRQKIRGSFQSFFKLDIIQEFFYSGIGCILSIILFYLFPKQYWKETYRITIILIFCLVFFFLFIIINQIGTDKKHFKVNYKVNIILFSIFSFSTHLFLFFDTHWGFNGLYADNSYRTAYITQMAYSGYPQDYAYKGLSAFYAPLYWYSLALLSRLILIPPYKMIRIGFLITCYIVPIILFESWKKIYDAKLSFFISIISYIYIISIYSPDHFIGTLLIIPFFMYYYENCTNKEFTKKDYILGGILGTIVFTTFFLYFIVIPIFYLISLFQNKSEFRKKMNHLVKLSISILIFSSWFWIPILRDVLFIGFESHQNRYFAPEALVFPLMSYIGFGIGSAISALGLVYIIRRYKLSNDIKILGNLLISVHVVFLLGFIGILIKFPIMHLRFMDISTYILIISACIFYVKFFHFIANNELLKSKKINPNLYQIEIYFLIFLIFARSTFYLIAVNEAPAYEAAHKGQSMREERDIIEELDYEEKVFLTNEWRVAAFLPIYLFLLPNPYYSHPSALYNERVEFLVELSECESPKKFHDKIMNNRFGPIDYFYLDLEDNSSKLVFEVAIEKFPEGREYYEIEFKIELFQDEDLFEEIVIDDVVIYETKY